MNTSVHSTASQLGRMLVAPCAPLLIDIPPTDMLPWCIALIDEPPLALELPPLMLMLPMVSRRNLSRHVPAREQYALAAMSSRCSVFGPRAGAWRRSWSSR